MVSNTIELLGLVLLVVGLYLFAPWLGVASAGASLVALGLALDDAAPAAAGDE